MPVTSTLDMASTVASVPTRRGGEPAGSPPLPLPGRVSAGLEDDDAQRGDADRGGGRAAVVGLRERLDLTEVPDAGAAVRLGVGVEDLAPATAARQSEAVALVRDAGEVDDDGDRGCVVPLAQVGEGVAEGVVGVDP